MKTVIDQINKIYDKFNKLNEWFIIFLMSAMCLDLLGQVIMRYDWSFNTSGWNVLSKVSSVPFERICKATVPFIIMFYIILQFITYIPQITLALPTWMYGA